ncbi:hypothetical protein ABT336_25690, partial [Micromonospora sp. NPDC000207]
MLVESLSSDSVPADLVYFRDGNRNLVVNPEIGGWQILDDAELNTLRRLANGLTLTGDDEPGSDRATHDPAADGPATHDRAADGPATHDR